MISRLFFPSFSACLMPPLSSFGSGWEGPPNSVLAKSAVSHGHISSRSYMFNPKNLMSCNLVIDVLLLRKARVSSIPNSTRAMIDIEMTVEPELYSIIVFVSGVTSFCNMFNAILIFSVKFGE